MQVKVGNVSELLKLLNLDEEAVVKFSTSVIQSLANQHLKAVLHSKEWPQTQKEIYEAFQKELQKEWDAAKAQFKEDFLNEMAKLGIMEFQLDPGKSVSKWVVNPEIHSLMKAKFDTDIKTCIHEAVDNIVANDPNFDACVKQRVMDHSRALIQDRIQPHINDLNNVSAYFSDNQWHEAAKWIPNNSGRYNVIILEDSLEVATSAEFNASNNTWSVPAVTRWSPIRRLNVI